MGRGEQAALVGDVEGGAVGGGGPPSGATFSMTVITLCKICVGTGVLAVPHAFSESGCLCGFLMLLFLLLWNDWSANRLLGVRDLLTAEELAAFRGARDESPLGALARIAAGHYVAASVELCLGVLMFGVATAYFVAFHDFLHATRLGPGFYERAPRGVDTFLAATLTLPLAMVDDIGALAYAGAAGLFAIAVSFAAIVAYGLESRSAVGWRASDGWDWVSPTSTSSLASGFGVLSYCFGIAPLALQLEASMAEPKLFPAAQRCALLVAFCSYFATGAGVARLYDGLPCAPNGVAGNVLDDLPLYAPWAAAPTLVRLAMAVVCVFSAPLGVVATGEIVEARCGVTTKRGRLLARGAVCYGAAAVAAALPVFALVVALVGCFAVSTLSFVLPSFLHLQLSLKRMRSHVATDALATVLGVVVVVFTTALTASTTAAALQRAALAPAAPAAPPGGGATI